MHVYSTCVEVCRDHYHLGHVLGWNALLPPVATSGHLCCAVISAMLCRVMLCFAVPCSGPAGLPGFSSVPHQRVGVGQLRTVKEPTRLGPRSRPTGAPAPLAGPGSSSNLVATGPISSISRQHVGLQVHHGPAAAADDTQEASPLLTGHGPSSLDIKGGAGDLGPAGVEGLAAPQQRDQPALQLGSLTTRQMLCSINFWLLFTQFTVASGVSLAYLNNLGQLVVSLGGGHDGHVVFVSLFSVANAAGAVCGV